MLILYNFAVMNTPKTVLPTIFYEYSFHFLYFDPRPVFCFSIYLVYFQSCIKMTLMLYLNRWYLCFDCKTVVRKCFFLKAHVFWVQWSFAIIQYLKKLPSKTKYKIKNKLTGCGNKLSLDKLMLITRSSYYMFYFTLYDIMQF